MVRDVHVSTTGQEELCNRVLPMQRRFVQQGRATLALGHVQARRKGRERDVQAAGEAAQEERVQARAYLISEVGVGPIINPLTNKRYVAALEGGAKLGGCIYGVDGNVRKMNRPQKFTHAGYSPEVITPSYHMCCPLQQ